MNKVNRKNEKDARINTSHFSIKGFLSIFIALSILTAGQAIIFNAFLDIHSFPSSYVLSMLAYWAIISLIFCLISARQRYVAYDKPMMIISKAAKKVAEGDYSIRVSPLRKDDKKDYVEVLIEDFNKMIEELGSTEILKNDFISNVSHEIKTPLSIIQSYAVALQKENLTKEQEKEYTETIITASKKLTTLVTNILKLSKLENQEIISSGEPYNICRQLIDCALSFEDLWEQKNITFIAEVEEKAYIHADEEMLEIVWNNLLANAIKFTEPGGIIELTQTSDTDKVTVSIKDNGPGMSEETKKHIFDKFYQGDSSHSKEGNGLGLALSLKVIDLIDGKISVKSSPGSGTEFITVLKKEKHND